MKGKQLLEICETFNITTSFQVQDDEITGAKACLNTNPNKTSNPTEAKETSVVNISAGNTYSKQRHLDEGKALYHRLYDRLLSAMSRYFRQ